LSPTIKRYAELTTFSLCYRESGQHEGVGAWELVGCWAPQ